MAEANYSYLQFHVVSILATSLVVHAINPASSAKGKGIVIIGPSFVTTPSPLIRFSNSTGAKLRCVATGTPTPVSNTKFEVILWLVVFLHYLKTDFILGIFIPFLQFRQYNGTQKMGKQDIMRC